MKNNNKVLSLLGLATKAGKVASGEFSTEKSVKTGKGFLVLVADDASQNTRKKFQNMCVVFLVIDRTHNSLSIALSHRQHRNRNACK